MENCILSNRKPAFPRNGATTKLGLFERGCLVALVSMFFAHGAQAQTWKGLPGRMFATDQSPVSAVMGDFNGDGITDIAVTCTNNETVAILIGNGNSGIANGTFQDPVLYAVGGVPATLVMGDFNNDTILDLATTNPTADTVTVLLGNGSGGVGDGTFQPGVQYATDIGPHGLVTGDFNGDDITDLATSNGPPGGGAKMGRSGASRGANTVSVLLGNGSAGTGNGTFQPPVNYGVGDEPQSIVTGDFNSDDITDLATCNALSDTVSVLLGNGSGGTGNGTFMPAADYAVGSEPAGLVTADFNGDMIADLAVSNKASDNASVLLGNGAAGIGNGTFTLDANYPVGDGPQNVIAGDFNEDGIDDLVMAGGDDFDVILLRGNGSGGVGDGTFQTATIYSAGVGTDSVAAGDLNGDGIADLVAVNGGGANISILLGDGAGGIGDGTFASAINSDAGLESFTAATADFNGDGILDIVTANAVGNDVTVLLGGGSGGVWDGTFLTAVSYAVGTSPRGVTTGDFNEDLVVDIVATNQGSSNCSVLIGIGNGTFQPAVNYGTGAGPRVVVTGDFNEDDIADLAIACQSAAGVSVLLGNGSLGVGDGTFGTAITYPADNGTRGVTTGDFNGDDITDLATANFQTDNVSILLGIGTGGVGNGTFQPPVNYGAGDQCPSVTTGDFNSGGITDLATANPVDDNVSILIGNGSGGVGDGTFQPAVDYVVGEEPFSIAMDDFDGDGIDDLVTANSVSHNVSVLLGNGTGGVGNGTFQSAIYFGTPLSPRSVATADFNGDGLPDVLTANFNTDTTSVLVNAGFADTTPPTSSATGPTGTLSQPSALFDVTWTADDSHLGSTGVADVELYYQLNGGGFTQYPGGPYSSSPISFNTSTTGGDGTYDFYTIARDNAMNVELKAPVLETSVTFNNISSVTDWHLLD